MAGFLGYLTIQPTNVMGTDVSGTIFDGSGGPWTSAGSPYVVIGDVTIPQGEVLTIEPDVQVRFNADYSILVDGSLYAVGNVADAINMTSNDPDPEEFPWYGLNIRSGGYAEIEFCVISYALTAISIDSSSGNRIANNTLWNNHGLMNILSSSGNRIEYNNMSDSGGIYLYHSDNNVFANNSFHSNAGAVIINSASDGTIVRDNIMSNSRAGISIWNSGGVELSNNQFFDSGVKLGGGAGVNSHTMQNNTVNGKPLYYYKDCGGIVLDGIPVGQVIFANCNNVEARNLQLSLTYAGVQLGSTTNAKVEGNRIWNTIYGIDSQYSDQNVIAYNNLTVNHRAVRVSLLSDDNTIENNYIDSNQYAISLDLDSNRNTIANNTISNSEFEGIDIYYDSNDNVVRNNTVFNNEYGIRLNWMTKRGIVEDNNIWNNDKAGIDLFESEFNAISGNNLANDGIFIWGDQLSHYNTQIIPESNILNGKPVYYRKNSSGLNIDGTSLGQVILANCTNVLVRGLQIGNAYVGIEAAYSYGMNITENTLSDMWSGIYLYRASGNEVASNEVTSSSYGMYVWSSSNNLTNNNLSHNGKGIYIHYSWFNNITENDFWNNTRGLEIYRESGNLVYHNNFYDNGDQAYESPSSNFWNDSYPSGGNYWSDYSGVDLRRGNNQDIAGPDGMGDTPYIIDTTSQDNYPLMAPFGVDIVPPEVTIISPSEGQILTLSPTIVTGTASDMGGSGLELVKVNVNDGAWSDATGTSSWTVSVDLIPGLNTLKAQAWDNAGYLSAIDSITVAYDPPGNDPPVASFTISPTTVGFGTPFEVNASASSDMEDSSSELEVRWDWEYDGIWDTDWSTTKTAQHQYTIPAVYTFPTIYTILMEVRDTGGLVANTSMIVSITMIDDFPLTCSITSPNQGETLSGTASIVGVVTDDANMTPSVEVRIDNGAWMPAEGNVSWTYHWDTTAVSDGEHVIYARAYDGLWYSDTVNVIVAVDNSISDGSDDWLLVAVALSIVIVAVIVMLVYILFKKRKTKGEEESIEPSLEEPSEPPPEEPL